MMGVQYFYFFFIKSRFSWRTIYIVISSKISLGKEEKKIPLLKPGWKSSVLRGLQGFPKSHRPWFCNSSVAATPSWLDSVG